GQRDRGPAARLPAWLPLHRRSGWPGRLRQPPGRPARDGRPGGRRRAGRCGGPGRAGRVPAVARVPGPLLVTRLHAFLTSIGYEDALAAELGGPKGPRWPGVVSVVLPVEEGGSKLSGSSPATVRGRGGGWEGDGDP